MKKVMICLTGCFLFALTTLRAQDTTRPAQDPVRPAADSTTQISDTAKMMLLLKDSGVVKPATTSAGDTAGQSKDPAMSPVDAPADGKSITVAVKVDVPAKVADTVVKTRDAADGEQSTAPAKQLDTRWFISPLLKLQFQDFAMLEKNREGYLSNANTLPFFQRGNASFAASAYKNLSSRLSFSADFGLSFGHVTSNNVEISQTQSRTYNLLAAAFYYHLLPASYRLQPYVSVGINDIINNASYVTVPIGIGAKFNARKVMVLAQVSYGEAVGKNIANTTMYSMGVYIPIGNKKHKQLDQDNPPYSRPDKDAGGMKKDKDSANKGGTVINNIYVTINIDSVLRARGLLSNDSDGAYGSGRRRGYDRDDREYASNNPNGSGRAKKRRGGLHNFDLDDFEDDDYKMDSLDGRPVIRFVVYFEFNDYGLNSRAFGNIDRVINHLKRTPDEFTVEIKGYTDSVGNDHYNNQLSRERAKMVLSYMNSRGIPVELMKIRAYGKDDPVADNGDPNRAWLNRRAEIIIHAKDAVANGQ